MDGPAASSSCRSWCHNRCRGKVTQVSRHLIDVQWLLLSNRNQAIAKGATRREDSSSQAASALLHVREWHLPLSHHNDQDDQIARRGMKKVKRQLARCLYKTRHCIDSPGPTRVLSIAEHIFRSSAYVKLIRLTRVWSCRAFLVHPWVRLVGHAIIGRRIMSSPNFMSVLPSLAQVDHSTPEFGSSRPASYHSEARSKRSQLTLAQTMARSGIPMRS